MFESFLKKFSRKSRTFYPPTAKHLNKFYNHTRGHLKNFAPILHTHSAIYSRQTSSAICNTYFPRAFHKPKKKSEKPRKNTNFCCNRSHSSAHVFMSMFCFSCWRQSWPPSTRSHAPERPCPPPGCMSCPFALPLSPRHKNKMWRLFSFGSGWGSWLSSCFPCSVLDWSQLCVINNLFCFGSRCTRKLQKWAGAWTNTTLNYRCWASKAWKHTHSENEVTDRGHQMQDNSTFKNRVYEIWHMTFMFNTISSKVFPSQRIYFLNVLLF